MYVFIKHIHIDGRKQDSGTGQLLAYTKHAIIVKHLQYNRLSILYKFAKINLFNIIRSSRHDNNPGKLRLQLI